MTNRNFLNRNFIYTGIVVGLVGGLVMIWLRIIDLGLGYIHGYLFYFNYFFIMFLGLYIYKRLSKGFSTYLERFWVGILIYLTMTICFFSFSSLFGKLSPYSTLMDKIYISIIAFFWGIFLSLVFAISFKKRVLQ